MRGMLCCYWSFNLPSRIYPFLCTHHMDLHKLHLAQLTVSQILLLHEDVSQCVIRYEDQPYLQTRSIFLLTPFSYSSFSSSGTCTLITFIITIWYGSICMSASYTFHLPAMLNQALPLHCWHCITFDNLYSQHCFFLLPIIYLVSLKHGNRVVTHLHLNTAPALKSWLLVACCAVSTSARMLPISV